MRLVWNKQTRDWVAPGPPAKRVPGPYIVSDTPPYRSPLGTGMIDGRTARREDMARGGSREVDPSEKLAMNPKTKKQAAAERASLAARPKYTMAPETRKRLVAGK